MKKALTMLALIICACPFTMAQPDQKYHDTLKKMLQVNGSEDSYETMIVQMISLFKKQYPNIDVAVWDEFAVEFLKMSLEELSDMLAPIYFKHLSQADLEAIIEFYETPAGIKLASKTPLIIEESMQVGQVWGQKIGEEFARKLVEKGYITE